MKVIKHNFLELLVNLFLFPQNHIPFAFDGPRLQFGILQDITDDIDGGTNVFAERLGVVHGLLAASVCVEVGSKVLDFEL
ncbi:hypothetical protein BN14_08887 [Rhizoctonia solani AG-1 IB]|uniref:Uncharacterized protein n=1 Tax=Thanatephorus cucumeris (strain AG1-IB / isolate 7/3/14) TaxID=1108050 RepID=M5C645_THACB|nr:hypothetical protein BN14_08887 [Rhizoctonia solani AG-1 IB]